MYTVSKNKNDYFYYLVKLRRCTKIETLIIRLSVLGVQNRFQLSRTFLQLCNFLAPPSVSRVNYTRIRLLSMRGYLRSALYRYNSVVSWFIAQLSRARALLCASTLKRKIFFITNGKGNSDSISVPDESSFFKFGLLSPLLVLIPPVATK